MELEATIDYEARSRLNLPKVGAINYSKHDSTSIFCLAYKVNDGPVKLWIPERAPMPPELWRVFRSKRGKIIAHNAAFERAMTKWCLPRYPLLTDEQRECLRSLPPSRWRCTAAKAAASSLPRNLEGACHALRLPTRKDMRGSKLIKKYMKPRKPSKNNPKEWWDDKRELRAIYRYCMTDVQAEYELDQALPDLTEQEQIIWEFDQLINDRGIRIDIPTVRLILGMISDEMKLIDDRVRKLSHDTIGSASQRAKVLAWVNERGAAMPNLKAETIRDWLEGKDLSPRVREMLTYRRDSSRTSTGKYKAMLAAVGSDERARELFLYCGAQPTARWASKRIQLQNMPRVTIKGFNSDEAIELIKSGGLPAIRKKYGPDKVMDVLVSSIRGMMIASFGRDFFCADSAQIEARIAFWVAGHEDGIKAFLEERKLYEEMASEAFGIPLDEVEKDSLERFVGKESVLGCQYGMGWKKFMSQCHKKLDDPKIRLKVDAEVSKKAVYSYRRVHWPVPEAWRKLENTVVRAIRNPGKQYKACRCIIYCKDNFLNIKLPSGRRLRYFRPRVSSKQLASGRMVPQIHHWGIELHQWCETIIWGGILFNHIVQGIARDLLAFWIQLIEESGYKMVLHAHDECLAERDKGAGDLKRYIGLMTKLPPWAKGAPIKAEGWQGERYRK